jgi:hypothetical protein
MSLEQMMNSVPVRVRSENADHWVLCAYWPGAQGSFIRNAGNHFHCGVAGAGKNYLDRDSSATFCGQQQISNDGIAIENTLVGIPAAAIK